jgi:hypothetical protein
VRITAASLAAVYGLCTTAQGQWTAVRLHNPELFGNSAVYSLDGPVAGGGALVGSQTLASLWDTATQSWSPLSPVLFSEISGMQGGHQVGHIGAHAALWSGTAGSAVDLHPPSSHSSTALAVWGNTQAGYQLLTPGAFEHAVAWHGTAASAVDLNPSWARASVATGTAAGQQCGCAQLSVGGATHGVLWSGSAASVVDLNPPGYIESYIYGMIPGQQAGQIRSTTAANHAAIWSGTPESVVDLNPAGFSTSRLFATCGEAQAGAAGLIAGVWFGTPESFVRLDQFLPAGYGISQATCVEVYQGRTIVGGYAVNNATGVEEAFVWINVPAPGTVAPALILAAAATRRRHRPAIYVS